MLDPCTVTDADPVPARLLFRTMLNPAVSIDQPSVDVPCRAPAVMITRRVPSAPLPVRHLTAVSDCHSVASHPVLLFRKLVVYASSPIPAPATVSDTDPVPARFLRVNADVSPTLYVMLSDMEPLRSPTVIICLTDAKRPVAGAWHKMLESDIQPPLLSCIVAPILVFAVCEAFPNPVPCSLSITEPVLGTFLLVG
jgi:hypothetical protein